ncbi:MAG: MBOAT family protein [Flavobacteriales bacterium]|jgi:alginate O-acetyltransferase complex protein AlgI|nr:MBOAT family protein [Flavobacteriales bacterium]MBK9076675.1 MBOAT family protein [Flavobacteriales bacterium]MBK9538090.1 MBOAT family protein [Flavobacteriales bacterium]
MLFNSIDFAVFLPIVFVLYWTVFRNSVRARNWFLIAAGCVFYGWWDWRFLALWLFTAGVDYLVALGFSRTEDTGRRKFLMGLSLTANLGLLGFFKYFDFFLLSFVDAFSFFGHPIDARPLGIVLPVGISFYTFQSLSYTFDVYRRKLPAVKDPSTFFAFVSFFPQLLAGPIERAHHMLPQFGTKRNFNEAMAYDGVRQMLWGLFKKVVVADNCAAIVNPIFADHATQDGSTLALAIVLFAFQIYGDFSGYSDIAIGCARLFGFELMRNFAYPYFSRDIAEFWRRWHISLSTWFRDYLYIPLGGSRHGKARTVRNTMIIFLVSGFWHGANWTFLAWGAVNGLLLLPLLLRDKHHAMTGIVAEGRWLPTLREAGQVLFTFLLACFAWTFFRAKNMGQAFDILGTIASPSFFQSPSLGGGKVLWAAGIGILITLGLEWLARSRQYGLQLDGILPRPIRLAVYYGLIGLLILTAPLGGGEFIYFQF